MAKPPMLIHFISLDRTPDRCREFLAGNEHLSHLSRFAALTGTIWISTRWFGTGLYPRKERVPFKSYAFRSRK